MAQFDIETDRLADPATWPDRCARCGAPGTALVPLPPRYAKRIPGVRLPFCKRHRTDPADVARRTRIAAVLLFVGMAASAVATWVLHPHLGGEHAGNDTSRVLSTILFGLFSAAPLGLLLLVWTRTPIRVDSVQGRFATVVAVCRAFRDAVAGAGSPPPLADIAAEATFQVSRYRPKPTAPADVAGVLFAAAVVAGGLFGALAAAGGLYLAPAELGWEQKGWEYVGLSAAPFTLLAWVVFGPSLMFRPRWVGLAVAAGAVLTGGVALLKVLTFDPYIWFSVAYSAVPLFALQGLMLGPIIWRGKVRHGPFAAVCGLVAPLVYAGAVYAVAGTASGPQAAALILGPIAALALATGNYDLARTPYCGACTGWLTRRRIGAFARSRKEVEPAVAGGEIVALAAERPYEKQAAIGDVELYCHSCEFCAEKGTVVVELFDCVKGGKHGNTPTLKLVDRYLYPGPAVLVLDEMFPPPAADRKAGAGG